MKGAICMFFPYKDPYLLTGQFFSVLAFGLSWVWYGTTSLSFLVMALYQGLWFCRQEKCSIFVYALLSVGAAALAIGTGIHVLDDWGDSSLCTPFFFVNNFQDLNESHRCNEQRYAYISLASGALWILASLSLIAFVASGNYDVCEKKWNSAAGGGGGGGGDDDESDCENDDGGGSSGAIRRPSARGLQKDPSIAAMMIAQSIADSARSREEGGGSSSFNPHDSYDSLPRSANAAVPPPEASIRPSYVEPPEPSIRPSYVPESRPVAAAAPPPPPKPSPRPVVLPQPSYVGSERGRMDSYV